MGKVVVIRNDSVVQQFETPDTAFDCAWGPQGGLVAAMGNGQLAVCCENPSAFKREHTRELTSIDWNSTGILSSSYDGLVKLWTINTPRSLSSIKISDDCVQEVRWSKRFADSFLAACSDKSASVWDISASRTNSVLKLEGHIHEVMSCDWSQDGQQVVTASADGSIRVWDLRNPKTSTALLAHRGVVRRVRYSQDNKLIASVGYDMTLRIWQEGKCCFVEDSMTEFGSGLDFAPNGSPFYCGWDGKVRTLQT